MVVLENSTEELTRRKNMTIVRMLLGAMKKEAPKLKEKIAFDEKPEVDDKADKAERKAKITHLNNVLHVFCGACSLEYAEQDLEILEGLAELLSDLEGRGLVGPSLESLLEQWVCHEGTMMTPLMMLCRNLEQATYDQITHVIDEITVLCTSQRPFNR